MNSIKLTNIQKLNLLVMCKKLFPEYSYIGFGNNIGLGGNKDYLYFYKIENELTVEHINIHWFEFCINYLSGEIFNHINYPWIYPGQDVQDGLAEMMMRQWWYRKEAYHPVNYLYEEFLKLKL